MSNCIITLTINGEEREIKIDSSPSTLIDESVIKALSENPEILKDLVSDLKTKLNSQDKIKPIAIKDILKEGVLANCTLNYLRESPEYCYLKFPDGNANILLVDNLKIRGVPISGRVIKQNGEEIYVVKNDKDDLQKFAYYLKEKNTIKAGVSITEDSNYYAELLEVFNKRKKGRGGNKNLENIEDMLLDYIDNKNAFTKIFLDNGKSAIQVLEKFLRNLKNYDTPIEYDDPFITALNYNKFYKGNGQIFTSYKVLYNLFKQYYPVLLDNLGITKESDFSKTITTEDAVEAIIATIQNSEEQNRLRQELSQSINGHDVLLRFVLSSEPDFTYSYKYQTKKGITLEQQYTPISNKYGITFDTISIMPESKYKGYNIYKDKDGYFISRGTLTESSVSRKYNSEIEAKTNIDIIISKQPIYKNSLIEFKFRESYTDEKGNKQYIEYVPEKIQSKTNFNKGQIIESLNVSIDRDTQIRGDEVHILANKNIKIKDFQDLVDTYKASAKTKEYIKEHINTPEKITLFIYKVNEILGNKPRKDKDVLQEIVDSIENADYKYYYVEDRYWINSKGWSYKLISLNKDEMIESKKNQGKPIRLWLDAIAKSLYNQFGVQIHIVTANEVAQMKVADPNIDKAFIYNGEIYVNSTIASTDDLLHEHVHLLLGLLKSNPELRKNYESLVNLVADTKEGTQEKARIAERYQGLSEMDLREEVFANLFSRYIRNQTSIETEQVFNSSETELERLTKSVFNADIYDIKSFYGGGLISIFNKFNKEVSKYMQDTEDIDFGATKQTRIISNWISKQIENGLIKEEC